MRKRSPILGVICLLILGWGLGCIFLAGASKAEITVDGKVYEMRTMTVGEFMRDGYVFATMSTEGDVVYTYDYSDVVLEAKSYYKIGVPFKMNGGHEASINCWLYNPSSEEVEVQKGKIYAVSCHIAELRADGIVVSIAGLELDGQDKAELKSYMDGALKGYRFSENEDVNVVSYTKGQVSYTFSFDEDDILLEATARNNV